MYFGSLATLKPAKSPQVVSRGMFENFGKTLLLLRELRSLNQAQFARLAGLGKSQVSKYEAGRELPKLSVLGRILGTLGFSLKDFAQALEYIDGLDGQQRPSEPAAVPITASTLLGPDVQKAFEELLHKVLALEREVLMSFVLQHTPPERSRKDQSVQARRRAGKS